jgi:hypothetical protein
VLSLWMAATTGSDPMAALSVYGPLGVMAGLGGWFFLAVWRRDQASLAQLRDDIKSKDIEIRRLQDAAREVGAEVYPALTSAALAVERNTQLIRDITDDRRGGR